MSQAQGSEEKFSRFASTGFFFNLSRHLPNLGYCFFKGGDSSLLTLFRVLKVPVSKKSTPWFLGGTGFSLFCGHTNKQALALAEEPVLPTELPIILCDLCPGA